VYVTEEHSKLAPKQLLLKMMKTIQ